MTPKPLKIAEIILLIVVVGVGAWLVMKKPGEIAQRSQTPTPSSIKTPDSKTYRNEKYGFEFQYPWDWILLENNLGKDDLVVLNWIPSSDSSANKISVTLTEHDPVAQRCASYPGTAERMPWREMPLESGMWKFCQEEGVGVFNPVISLYIPTLKKFISLTGGKTPSEQEVPGSDNGIDQRRYIIISIARTFEFTK